MDKKSSFFEKYYIVTKLQKKILHQCLHDIQSPISAVSGYLELMKMNLDASNDSSEMYLEAPASKVSRSKDSSKMVRYRDQLQTGFEEVEMILSQIRYIHDNDFQDFENNVDVEINVLWFIDEVCKNMKALSQKKNQEIVHRRSPDSLYIKTDLFLLKLVLANLMIQILKITHKDQAVEVYCENEEPLAAIHISSASCEKPVEDVINYFLQETGSTTAEASQPELNNRVFFGAKAIHLLNGTIEVKQKGKKGFHICLKLPL